MQRKNSNLIPRRGSRHHRRRKLVIRHRYIEKPSAIKRTFEKTAQSTIACRFKPNGSFHSVGEVGLLRCRPVDIISGWTLRKTTPRGYHSRPHPVFEKLV